MAGQRPTGWHAAAVPAVDRREDDGADRPGDEGQREHGEGVERRRHGLGEREEHLGKDDHRGDAEHEEVEILRGAPDDDAEWGAGDGGPARLRAR